MFSFLYLFGPGVISWLVCRYFLPRKDRSCVLVQLCEILAYAAVTAALTCLLLEPSGDVEVTVSAAGMPIVRYGAKGLALSAALAAGIGVLGSIGLSGLARYKRRLFTAGTAAAAGLCIFAYGVGAPVPDASLRISTKPVRINNVYYDSDVPLYVNDAQEYYIQVRALAQFLGISYEEEQTGLLRTEYRLGENVLALDPQRAGSGYFKKDGELFLSFTELGNLEGIQVKNSALLTDGSSRQVIYIDNYVQRFHYDWTQHVYAAHALGGIDGITYTNAKEALIENYNAGHRVFEVDLRLTRDGGLAAVHDLPENEDGEPMTQAEFKADKVQGKYTPLTFQDLARLMKKYPDMYLITDTKETDAALITKQFSHMAEAGNKIDPEILKRIIPQIYHMEMLDTIMQVYEWDSVIFTLYALADFSEKEVIDFAYQQGIGVITTHAQRAQTLFLQELYERDIKVYLHTINTQEEEAEFKRGGGMGTLY